MAADAPADATAKVPADPAPRTLVRAHLEPAGPVVAGSEVKLVVELLTTSWFTEAPDWPLFTVPGAIVSLPDEQARNLSEDIDGVRWFGVSRAYRIAPQAGRTYDVAPFAITLHPGGIATPVQVMTPALRFVATLPPGAEQMKHFFAAPRVTVTQKIEPPNGQLRAGAIVTRSITQTASGTESMLIPPVEFGDVDGLKRYARTPVTHDVVQDRAGLVAGERTDSVAYLADHSGRFSLPPVTIEWWDTATQKKQSVVLPGVKLSVSAAHEKPLFEIPADALSRGAAHRLVVIHGAHLAIAAALVLVLIALIGARARLADCARRLRGRVHALRERYRDGEWRARRSLYAAARHGDLRRLIPALYRWMERRGDLGKPARVDRLPGGARGDISAIAEVVARHYDTASAAAQPAPATPRGLLDAVRELTKRTRKPRRRASPLPPLN
ncbi:hypothetical protein BTH42_26430 [Burkholderia sp. SRS-W-2-2016]|nr:hypothetical protein BTH42_26430 [Burkholderia sp. SRS-W-2-2016]